MAPRVTVQPANEAPPEDPSFKNESAIRSVLNWLNRAGDATIAKLAAHPRLIHLAIWTTVATSMAVGVWMWANGFLDVEQVGYPATFYLNVIGSASILIPIPGVLAVCVAATESLGLHLGLLGLIGGTGAALGETTAYLAGFAGHSMVENVRWYPRIRSLMERRGGITIFVLAFIPNPVIDVAGIAAGALGYPYKKFIVYVFIGKTLRLIIMAYACRESIEWLEDLFRSQFAGLF